VPVCLKVSGKLGNLLDRHYGRFLEGRKLELCRGFMAV
jgi:hypothetical protein